MSLDGPKHNYNPHSFSRIRRRSGSNAGIACIFHASSYRAELPHPLTIQSPRCLVHYCLHTSAHQPSTFNLQPSTYREHVPLHACSAWTNPLLRKAARRDSLWPQLAHCPWLRAIAHNATVEPRLVDHDNKTLCCFSGRQPGTNQAPLMRERSRISASVLRPSQSGHRY